MLRAWLICLTAALVVFGCGATSALAQEETTTEETDEATEEEATEEEATEEEATEEEEAEEVELDCNGLDLAEFTARVTEHAESRGLEPPPEERIQELFRHADHNGDGRIGPREAHRLGRHGPRPARHHARIWRHRIICREVAE